MSYFTSSIRAVGCSLKKTERLCLSNCELPFSLGIPKFNDLCNKCYKNQTQLSNISALREKHSPGSCYEEAKVKVKTISYEMDIICVSKVHNCCRHSLLIQKNSTFLKDFKGPTRNGNPSDCHCCLYRSQICHHWVYITHFH